jgi:Protein of unknown function (DUF2877)
MIGAASMLHKIAGFEATDYALLNGRVVWVGEDARTDHPRNARTPWRPQPLVCDAPRLRAGAMRCVAALNDLPVTGLLLWLTRRPLPFPLNHASTRFDALRDALEHNDLAAFAAAAGRVLGLGPGLTPSGDDFLGGILFALNHAPRAAWRVGLPAVLAGIREQAAQATNPISAALLDDLMAGASYRALHDTLAALQSDADTEIARASQALLRVGASSGADMLAGLLLALLTLPAQDLAQPTPCN